MRALSSGDLPAIRDNRNAWKIDVSDLEKWASERSGQAPDQTTDSNRTDPPDQPRTIYMDTPETMVKLAVAEARLSDVTAERDRLVKMLEVALERRPSIIDRLFGRS
jgi:hypothetical protein